MIKTIAATALATVLLACGNPLPSASKNDPAGIVMGTKTGDVLMIGVLNRATAYERSATPAQIRACTRQPSMRYPHCLP